MCIGEGVKVWGKNTGEYKGIAQQRLDLHYTSCDIEACDILKNLVQGLLASYDTQHTSRDIETHTM